MEVWKRWRSRAVSVVLTCGMLGAGILCAMHLLVFKYESGRLNLDHWKKKENERADILFMGNSAIADNIDLAELWQKYGIAGYDMGAGSIDISYAYYRIREAEKYHHPELIVLDVQGCGVKKEYEDAETRLGGISTLQWSWNKLYGVRATVPPEERTEYFFAFPLYHDRYNDLTKNDFLYSNRMGRDNKGQWEMIYQNTYTPELASSKDILTYMSMDAKQEYFFRKILEYCRAEHIEILVVRTPGADRINKQPVYNTVEMIAGEYDVPYLNMNLYDEEIGLTASDFANNIIHLNIKGARKCADFFGEYLISHYNLTDHRGDPAYGSWDRFAAKWESLYLSRITDNDDYFAELQHGYKTVMAVPYRLAGTKHGDDSKLQEQLRTIDYFDWDKEDELYGEENAGSFIFGDNEVVITKDYNNCEIRINEENEINSTQPGLFLIVYDGVTDEIADIVEFERNNGYILKHLYNP